MGLTDCLGDGAGLVTAPLPFLCQREEVTGCEQGPAREGSALAVLSQSFLPRVGTTTWPRVPGFSGGQGKCLLGKPILLDRRQQGRVLGPGASWSPGEGTGTSCCCLPRRVEGVPGVGRVTGDGPGR